MPRRILKTVSLCAGTLMAAIQFVGSPRTNPPVDEARALRTSDVFDRACANCHSNRTRWPWYSHVAPASWFVVGHVDHARSHMNASDWARFTPAESDHMLASMCTLARKGEMPLRSYPLLHEEARLSAGDVTALCEWTEAARREQAAAGEGSAERR